MFLRRAVTAYVCLLLLLLMLLTRARPRSDDEEQEENQMIDQTDMDCELNVSIGEMLVHLESNYSVDFSSSMSVRGEEET